MSFKYIPHKLIEVKDKIKIEHPLEGINNAIPSKNDDFKKLIIELVSLENYQLRMRAMSLTKKEISAIVRYLPYNFYNVDMSNLFIIFQYRYTKDLVNNFYYHWLDSYSNEQCNKYIVTFLLNTAEQFIVFIREHHLDEKEYAYFLEDGEIALKYGLKIKNQAFTSGMSLQEKLEYFGVRYNSRLYKDCEFLFYTFCGADDYLNADWHFLLDTIKKYNDKQIKQFMENFLSIFELRDLISHFTYMFQYLEELTGEPTSGKFKQFFKDFPQNLIIKYTDWLNSYKVKRYFGNDERSLFWQNYRYQSVSKHTYSNSIIMDFGNYIAIEFLGQAMGPAYIYDKKYYQDKVEPWFLKRIYTNTEMRQQLYHKTSYGEDWFNGDGYRKIHNSNWKSRIHSTLIRYDMTSKII